MSNKEPSKAEVLQARFYAITAAEKQAWDQMVSVMHTLFQDPA
jgi:hypothetical protein